MCGTYTAQSNIGINNACNQFNEQTSTTTNKKQSIIYTMLDCELFQDYLIFHDGLRTTMRRKLNASIFILTFTCTRKAVEDLVIKTSNSKTLGSKLLYVVSGIFKTCMAIYRSSIVKWLEIESR